MISSYLSPRSARICSCLNQLFVCQARTTGPLLPAICAQGVGDLPSPVGGRGSGRSSSKRTALCASWRRADLRLGHHGRTLTYFPVDTLLFCWFVACCFLMFQALLPVRRSAPTSRVVPSRFQFQRSGHSCRVPLILPECLVLTSSCS
jgi:hypothetical protein